MNFPPARRSFDFLGRLCLAVTFSVGIPTKIFNFHSVVNSISNQGIPPLISAVLLVAAIVCLIGGVVCLLFAEDQRIGPALLLIFLVPTTMIMHLYPLQSLALFMNLGLIGGLIVALTRANN